MAEAVGAKLAPIMNAAASKPRALPGSTEPGETMHWTDPDGGSAGDWMLPVGVGLGVGALGAMGAGWWTSNTAHSFRANIVAVAAAGVIGLAAGTAATWGLRELSEREPDLPNPKDAPLEIKPRKPVGAPGDQAPVGTRAGEATGSYQELETYYTYRTETYTDSDGNTRTRTVTETHYRWVTRWFEHDYDLIKQRGRMDGYETLDKALRDLNGRGQAAILKRDDDRYHIYTVDEWDHWGDIDRMYISNPQVEAMVSPSGRVWLPGSGWGGNFREATQLTGRDPVADMRGRDIGRFAMVRRTDPGIQLLENIGPGAGYEDAQAAVGDAKARRGNQAVVARGNRYYVFETKVGNPNPDAELRGIRTKGKSAGMVEVLELGNEQFAPSGDWWVRTRPAE